MNPTSLGGTFTVRSNLDGDWYEVDFRPDQDQTFPVEPDVISVAFAEPDRLLRLDELIGAQRESELAYARAQGLARFSGEISKATYFELVNRKTKQ